MAGGLLGETLRKLGFQVTADSTVYRKVVKEKAKKPLCWCWPT